MPFLFVIMSLLSSAAHATESASRYLGSCDYYPYLAQELGCPQNEYLIQFGEHYCRKFDSRHEAFSEYGQLQLDQIKRCLQVSLEETAGLNCQNVKAVALQSHIDCYQQAHFCQMLPADRRRLAFVIAPALFEDLSYWQIMFAINGSCL